MDETFDIQAYMTRGVESIAAGRKTHIYAVRAGRHCVKIWFDYINVSAGLSRNA